ncbi:hypothetical protein IGS73_09385 [Janibacter indicus]|uniref:Uncharacterized protein n=1 Tax=Janibacter indicus TaxID=857417 RepID=A0A7L9IX83_9MICO|nr:hypothetical protein [Janibacter indicus]QOK21393.1 hypothetical protein IGS73_09385 [Janibacter indicus]
MTSMPASAPASQQSSDRHEHQRIPLRHGLTAVIVRYRDDEPRPERPTHVLPHASRQQAEYAKWLAGQRARRCDTPGGGAA